MTTSSCSVTFLVENTEAPGLRAEHGLSLWIETPNGTILFDSGQSGTALLANADHLGIDLDAAGTIVLSHGHYDHTGGLAQALTRNRHAAVIFHPEVFHQSFALREVAKPIGIPEACAAALKALPPERLRPDAGPTEILPGIGTTGQVPRTSGFEDTGGPFFLDREGTRPDEIPDDQSLWFKTPGGLVVVTGCAHSGVVNTVRHAQAITGESRIAGVIGGFHLVAASAERMDRTIRIFKDWGLDFIAPCHCTGQAAVARIRDEFGARAVAVATGATIRF